MNKLFKKLFAPIAILSMALSVTSVVNSTKEIAAGAATTTTTLVFPQLGTDSSTAFTTATISTVTGSLKDTPNGTFVTATTQTNNVYAGTKGFKYGSSSVVGKWTFNTAKVVTKIVLVFDKFGTDPSSKGKVTSVDDSKTATTAEITGPTTLTLDNISSDTFTIEAQIKRLYLTSVEFTHEADAGNIPATGVTLSPKSLNLVAGGATSTIIPTVSPVDATDKTGVFTTNNNQVATVSTSGVVTPLKQGTATITFTTNSGGFTDTATVVVDFAPLISISLNKATSNIILGDFDTLTVTANPITASNLVTWTSSNELVATVSDGVITALSVGTTTITATSTQDNSKTATSDIEVVPVPVWSRFTKITDSTQLHFGATYIIANSDGSMAMSKTASTNNIPQVATTLESGKIVDSSNIMKVQLGLGTVTGSYSLQSISSDSSYDGLYLYAASSSSNYLRLKETKDADASWSISFTEGTPLLVAQGTNTRETMQYNSGSSLFSAYDSASQGAIALYLDESSVDHTIAATIVATEINSGKGSTAQGSCAATLEFLNNAYGRLSSTAKNTFDTSSNSEFVSARARLTYLGSWVAANPSGRPIMNSNGTNNLFAVFAIGAIGLTSILAYYFLNKKKAFR